MAVKYESPGKAVLLCAVFLLFAVGCLFLTGALPPDRAKTNGGGGKSTPFRLFRAALLCLFFVCGAGDFALFASGYQSVAESGEYYVNARVKETRDYGNSVYLILDDLFFDSRAAEGKLCLYLYKTDAFQPVAEGDTVAFDAKITANTQWKESAEENGGNGGNGTQTRVYEWRRGIKYEAKSCKNLRVTGEKRNVFQTIRLKLKQTLDLSMDGDSSALCFAILTGETAEINGELLDSFRYGGVAHIFAVSGLHVGALFAFITALFRKGKPAFVPPVAKWAVAAALIAFYGGICGFSSGVVRAAVMCLTAYADKLLGVKSDTAESMGKAAVFVLVLSPVSLFDAGFLLSFSAVFGILFLAPALRRFFLDLLPQKASERALLPNGAERQNPVRAAAEKCLSYLSVTIAATAFTAPVLSGCFGYVSGVSLALNMLIVPLIGAAFPICLLIAFFSLIFSPLAQAVLYVPSTLFSAISTLFYAFDFSRAALEFSFSSCGVFFCFAALFSLSDKFNVKYVFRAIWFGACFVALILSFFF